MPTSLLAQWPFILDLLARHGPLGRVLDVGPGTGKAPVLIRDDGRLTFDRIDALEAYQGYIEEWSLRALYRAAAGGTVMCGRFEDQPAERLCAYDTILMIDVLEHMDKGAALAALGKTRGQVVICTPVDFAEAWAPGMPVTEHHVSLWRPAELELLGRWMSYSIKNRGWLIRLGPVGEHDGW